MIDIEREREAETQEKGESGSMPEPDAGLNPGTPGSRPEPKAGAILLSHPGIPSILVLHYFSIKKINIQKRKIGSHLKKE